MTIMRDLSRDILLRVGILLAVTLLVAVGPVRAQLTGPAVGLNAWLGCWQPTGASVYTEEESGTAPILCFVTGPGGVIEVVTLLGGEEVRRERLLLGERRSTSREGCTGWESLSASTDGRRVYRQSEQLCSGGLERRGSGLMAMSSGEWLDVEGVSAGGYTDVRVVRYRSTSAPPAIAAEVASTREGRSLAIEATRMHAATPVEVEDIIHASRVLHPEVIEAWLVEHEQGFALDARRLEQLASAGVSGRVIDLMVALSYPQRFAIDRNLREGELRPGDDAQYGRPRVHRPGLGRGPWLYPDDGYLYGYGPGFYGYGYRRYPIVIVVRESDGDAEQRPRARAVPGRGYTRGGGSTAAPAGESTSRDRPSETRPGSRSGSGSAAPSSSGSGASSPGSSSTGSGGSSTGRTAQPRPPGD